MRCASIACLVGAASLGWIACGNEIESPESSEAAIAQAVELLGAGKSEEAVDLLRPFVSRGDFDPTLSLVYGRALVQNQQASLAIWPLERATRADDAPEGARALFVQALFLGGAARDSIREATRILEEAPENDVVRRFRAEAYEANLQLDEALADYDALVANDPGNPRILEAKLDLLTKAERHGEAREVIDRLRALMDRAGVEPEAASHFCAAAARFELDRGETDEALRQIEACAARFPNDPTVLLSRVEILDGAGRESDATTYLETIAKEAPNRLRIQYALATRLAALERWNDAEAALLAAAKSAGGSQPLLALADMRVARRDFPGAAQAVLDAIRNQLGRGPGDADFSWKALPAEAQFAFGDVFITAEDFAHAKEIIEAVDQEGFKRLLTARLALATGDPAKALEEYEAGFKFWPANPGARYLAGVAAMQLGEFDRSVSYYQDAMRADMKANDAGLVLARMLIAQGYPGAAMDTLGLFVRENEDEPHATRLFASAAMMAGAREYAEGARAKLAEDLDWAGVAMADHARDVGLIADDEEASRYLNSSKQLEAPTHHEALWAWVELEAKLGRFEAAARRIEELARRDPAARGHALNLARVQARRGRVDEARRILEPVVEAQPDFRAGQLELGRLEIDAGLLERGLERLDQADRLDPLEPDAGEAACLAALDRAPGEESERRCEAFLVRHPWDGRVALRLARTRLERADHGERTLVLARQAVRFVASAGRDAHAVLGRVLLARGDAKEALAVFARAVEVRGASTADRLDFARALGANGRAAEARSALDGLLREPELEPVEADAARALRAELGDE